MTCSIAKQHIAAESHSFGAKVTSQCRVLQSGCQEVGLGAKVIVLKLQRFSSCEWFLLAELPAVPFHYNRVYAC